MAGESEYRKAPRFFFSYAHESDCDPSMPEICKMIKEAMERRGYSVWTDKAGIPHGRDWRERIHHGIAESQGVVAYLSKRAVRDPGVCLDELAVAVAAKGGNIVSIFLEPESEVRPPAALTHRQWLDMSRWQEEEEKGEESFSKWFGRRMEELFGALESEEIRDFDSQISAIAEKLGRPDRSRERALLEEEFVGREWLVERVGEWLSDPDGAKVCMLYGSMGVGKSAFAAHLSRYGCGLGSQVAAALFFRAGEESRNEPDNAVRALAYLLACRLPDYRAALKRVLSQERELPGDANSLFGELVSKPMSRMINGNREPVCIIVDGLNECDSLDGNNSVAKLLSGNFLGNAFSQLPNWVRLLVCTQDEASIAALFDGAHEIRMDDRGQANVDDIRSYLDAKLEDRFGSEEDYGPSLDRLAQASDDIFLYAKCLADGLLSSWDAGSLTALTKEDALPKGVGGALERWFEWAFPNRSEYDSGYRDMLGAILASPAPLPEEELRVIFGWSSKEENRHIERMRVHLERGEDPLGKRTVAFSHDYVGKWLGGKAPSRFRVYPDDAIEQMARAFYKVAGEKPSSLTVFEAAHLLDLLRDADMQDEYERMVKDPDFATSCDNLGNLLRDRNDFAGAEALLRGALEICRGLAASDPAAWEGDLAYSCRSLGNLLSRRGDLDEAEALLREALTIYRELAASDPDAWNSGFFVARSRLMALLRRRHERLTGFSSLA